MRPGPRFRRRVAYAATACIIAVAAPAAALAPAPCIVALVRVRRVRLAQPRPAPMPLPAVLQPLAPWLPLLYADARAEGVPPSLVAAVALVESGGDARAVSAEGAVGVLQVTPVAARELGLPMATDAQRILVGAAYLAYLARQVGASSACLAASPDAGGACGWRVDLLVSAYNAGLSAPVQWGYVRAVRGAWVRTRDAMEGDAA